MTAASTTVPSSASARTSRRFSWRRWWRRRPVNRLLVLVHRWPALVLGTLLVVETTVGAVLLYEPELYRATSSDLYHHTAGANPIAPQAAIDIVAKAHPKFGAEWAAVDHGIYTVGNDAYDELYFVDSGNGHINGVDAVDRGVLGFLVNLHDCAFSCEGYTGYASWLGEPVWEGGPTFLTDIAWAGFILGTLGLLLILVTLTSIKIWWPGRTKLASRVKVRTGKGRFARDYDLHNVIGAVALPFLLMWGITGAAFEFPVVEKVWLAVTGGDDKADPDFAITPNKVAKGTPLIGAEKAVSVALGQVDGRVVFVGVPDATYPFYEIDLVSGYGSSQYRHLYGGGDTYVLVDPHVATHSTVLYSSKGDAASNRFYDKYLEPTHLGWNVNGWWRILWFLFGIAPLALMVTGVSTWLARRGVRKRRKRALAASSPTVQPVDDLDEELKAGHVDELDPELVTDPRE